jgi:F-type H+-transporting ATPase subunit delta
MKESNLARRYARALVASLAGDEEYAGIAAELVRFRELLLGDESLKVSMETQLISSRQKRELLDLISRQLGLSPKAYSFLSVVIAENRLFILGQIVEQLENVWYEKLGIDKMTVFSPAPLDAGQEKRLKLNLEKSFHRKLILKNEIDPSLLAGLRIQYGSESFDFSLKGNLEKLRERLAE